MFADCIHCGAWGYLPKGWKEAEREFHCSCPRCGQEMYLSRGLDPISELAYSTRDQVKVTPN